MLEEQADAFRRSQNWDKFYERLGQGWRQWLNYFRLIHQPLQ
jgi:hypothetical protein